MTYFGFLALFLGIPLALVSAALLIDKLRGRDMPADLSASSAALRLRSGQGSGYAFPAWAAVFIHVIAALVYTTPWDNYLVATGVWTYNPRLVTGVTLGWVPIEEYTFFVLQTVLAGSWLLFLARTIGVGGKHPGEERRPWKSGGKTVGLALLGIVWFLAAGVLLAGWKPGTYLGLILIWAIPPIALQIFFGADLLWRHRRLVLTALVSMTVYLGAADSLAIGSGTWTIAPDQSLNIYLGGVLPVEEFIFFLVTNTLIVFGITLLLNVESHARLQEIIARFTRREYTTSQEHTLEQGRKLPGRAVLNQTVLYREKTLKAAREGRETADR